MIKRIKYMTKEEIEDEEDLKIKDQINNASRN